MPATVSNPTDTTSPRRDLAYGRDISQDQNAARQDAPQECECDDCDCPICYPGCC